MIEPCTYPLCPMPQWMALNCTGCTDEARRKIRVEQEAIKSAQKEV